MLCLNVIAVYLADSYIKHKYSMWGNMRGGFSVKSGGTYSYHCVLMGLVYAFVNIRFFSSFLECELLLTALLDTWMFVRLYIVAVRPLYY
jgi:hypothetical protein